MGSKLQQLLLKNNMKKILLLTLLCSGCSSITTGIMQTLQINTTCNDRAIITNCSLSNENGYWIGNSYSKIEVQKGFGNLTIQCKSTSFPSETITIKSKSNILIYGNAILGGGVGAIYDINNGSGFTYPDYIDFKISSCTNESEKTNLNDKKEESPKKKDLINYKYKEYIHYPPLERK